jgi:hypothetical protein
MRGHAQQPQRGKWRGNRAGRIHHSLEAEGTAVCLAGDRRRQQRFTRRCANAASQPGRHSGQQNLKGARGEPNGARGHGGDGVADHNERLAATQPVREMAGDDLRDAREAVRRAFNRPEPPRPGAERHEQRRQDRCRNFVAPIAQQACQPDAECGAVQPMRFRSGFARDHGCEENETMIGRS